MIVSVIRCDRCKKLVDSPPPDGGATAGYYEGWRDFTNPDEEHVCDSCMWNDPRYIKKFGKQIDPDRAALQRMIDDKPLPAPTDTPELEKLLDEIVSAAEDHFSEDTRGRSHAEYEASATHLVAARSALLEEFARLQSSIVNLVRELHGRDRAKFADDLEVASLRAEVARLEMDALTPQESRILIAVAEYLPPMGDDVWRPIEEKLSRRISGYTSGGETP